MPSILLVWPIPPEADVDGMAVEFEPSHQYSITFCYHVTDSSKGAVWQSGVWHGSVYEAKVCHWIPLWEKNCTHWNSSTVAEHYGNETLNFSTVKVGLNGQYIASNDTIIAAAKQ